MFICCWQLKNQEVLLTIRYGVIQDSEFVLKCRKGKIAWICFITWMPARLHRLEEDIYRLGIMRSMICFKLAGAEHRIGKDAEKQQHR